MPPSVPTPPTPPSPPSPPSPTNPPMTPDQIMNAAQGLIATIGSDLKTIDASSGNAMKQLTQAATGLQNAVTGLGDVSTAISDAVKHIQEIADDFGALIKSIPKPPGPPLLLVIARLDGVDYKDPVLLRNDIISKVDAAQASIQIEWYGPDTVAFSALLSKEGDDLKKFVREVLFPPTFRILLPPNFWDGMTPELFWIMIGVVLIIIAVGITFVGICIGLAILYAVYKDYNVNAENRTSLKFGDLDFSNSQIIKLLHGA